MFFSFEKLSFLASSLVFKTLRQMRAKMNRSGKSIPQEVCFLEVPAARNTFTIRPPGFIHVDNSCVEV